MSLVLQSINHSLEVGAGCLQEDFLVYHVKALIVFVSLLHSINEAQLVKGVGFECIFDSDLSLLKLQSLRVGEHVGGEGCQAVVEIKELHFVVYGQMHSANVPLEGPL